MTDERVTVTLEAKTRAYLRKLEEGKRKYAEFVKSIDGNSKKAKSYFERIGKGQAELARSQEASLKRMNRNIQGNAQEYDESTREIAASLRRQRVEQDKTADSAQKSSALVRRAIASVSLAVITQQGLAFEEVWRGLNNTLKQYSDILGDAEDSTQRLNQVASEAGVPIQNLSLIHI